MFLQMNETYQQPGRWHELVLTPPLGRTDSAHHFMVNENFTQITVDLSLMSSYHRIISVYCQIRLTIFHFIPETFFYPNRRTQ